MIIVRDNLNYYRVTKMDYAPEVQIKNHDTAFITLKRINVIKRFVNNIINMFSSQTIWCYPLSLMDQDFIHMPLSYNVLSERLGEFGIELPFCIYERWRVGVCHKSINITSIKRVKNKLTLKVTLEYDVQNTEDTEEEHEEIKFKMNHRNRNLTKNRKARHKRKMRYCANE